MAVINTNVKALFSQAALKLTERNQQVSMQQLSTGKRINSSRDDAAGVAIATRMTQQIRSLNQAVRNAGDAITLIQTAEGATSEITDMMQRMRELAIQASNDTNNNEQRSYLDLEFQQLKKQIVQIANNTEWNGFPVLNGSTGERVGIRPVYKTTSEPMAVDGIQVNAGKPTSTSAAIRTGGALGAVTGVTEESLVTFPEMGKGQTITVAGLTYTATVANSAAEVAAAFANLNNGASTGPSTKGTYSGTLSSFKAGPVSASSSVSFTSITRFTNVTDIDVSSGTSVLGGTVARLPTVNTPSGQQGAAGGGIVLGGAGSFVKSGALSVVADGPNSVRSATFTLDDGQIIDLHRNQAVTISSGVVTIHKTQLERSGIHILTANVTLNQYGSSGGAAAFAAGDVVGLKVSRDLPDLEKMYASDVIINGIPIGAAREVDDTASPQSGNQIASAIAKAAAINDKTPATGVHATVNATLMTGTAMSGTGQARGTLTINGFTTPMIDTVLDNPRDSRIAVATAINFIAAQTGVRAMDSLMDSKGIILVADDGRNIEVAFNTASADADFARLTGLKQGVQAGTFSLESAVETAVNITSAANGNIHRAGLQVATYDSTHMTTVTTKPRAAVTQASGVRGLNINDLAINGVAIRAADPADDTLSMTQSVTSKAEASGIATAAAINASSALTGVTAVPVPLKITGDVTSTDLPSASTLAATADSTVSLFINGKNIPVVMSTTQTDSDRRAAVVAAIHANAGLTAVDAHDNGNGGVTLTALDGRNVSVWFDSNQVNASSFGLGEGTVTHTPEGVTAVVGGNISTTSAATLYASVALQSEKAIQVESGPNGVGEVSLGLQQTPAVAQVSQISISSTQGVVTATNAGTYIEFADMGIATESLSIPDYNGYDGGSGPASVRDAISFQGGILYRGDGVNPIPIGKVDSNLDGTLGKPLRINLGYVISDPTKQFFNPVNQHYYEVVTPASRVIWDEANTDAGGKTLFGLKGYLATVTSQGEQNFINANGMFGWIGASDRATEGQWNWVTGPETGTLFFQTAASGSGGVNVGNNYSNWNVSDPDFGGKSFVCYLQSSSDGVAGKWNDVDFDYPQPSYIVEYGGGGLFGTYAAPTLTTADLQNIQSRVIYSDSSANSDTASITINGISITSAPTSRDAESIATALEVAINDQIDSGALQHVAVHRYGSTLSIQATLPGTPFNMSGASTNYVGNTISAQTIVENETATLVGTVPADPKSHFADLGFYEGTFGGEVNEATSKMSPPRTGRLAFQIGANEGQKITIDLADFGKGGPITGEITWDADMDPMALGARIPDPVQGGPSLMGKPHLHQLHRCGARRAQKARRGHGQGQPNTRHHGCGDEPLGSRGQQPDQCVDELVGLTQPDRGRRLRSSQHPTGQDADHATSLHCRAGAG